MTEEWTTVWTAPGERLFVQALPRDGWTAHRFASNGEGDGAVAIAVRDGAVLFLRLYRPATGRTLVELPRGQRDAPDPDAIETARRELREESGWLAVGGAVVGEAWPDSGVCGDCVQVVRFDDVHEPTPESLAASEGEEVLWLTPADIRRMIATGEIADGISLSALLVAGVL